MSASTGDVLYDRPFSFPSASIAFCRGRAKRDPSVGVFWSKSASFRQFQWRGESLGEAHSAVGFVGNSPPVRDSGLAKKCWAPIRIAQHNYQLYVGKDGNTSASRSRTTKLQFSLSANLKMSCRQAGMPFP